MNDPLLKLFVYIILYEHTSSFGMEIFFGSSPKTGVSKHPFLPENHDSATSGSLVTKCRAAVHGVSEK